MSEGSFVRAMDVSGIGLTKEELGLLIQRYRAPGDGGLIDYQKFCDQSNKVRNMCGVKRPPSVSIYCTLDPCSCFCKKKVTNAPTLGQYRTMTASLL